MLTDNEIIKALECCSSGDYKSCKKCPLFENCNTPIYQAEIIMKNGLDLINRLQAENERLKASRDKWKEIATIFDQAIRDKDATIEMLEEMVGEE